MNTYQNVTKEEMQTGHLLRQAADSCGCDDEGPCARHRSLSVVESINAYGLVDDCRGYTDSFERILTQIDPFAHRLNYAQTSWCSQPCWLVTPYRALVRSGAYRG